MRSLLITVLLFLTSTAASADELLLGLWSKHWDSASKCEEFKCNEEHNLVGYVGEQWFVGTYKNTLFERSYLVGWKSKETCLNDYVCYDLWAGAVSGYGESESAGNNEIVPFLSPRVKIGPVQIFGVPGVLMAAGFVYEF